MPLISLLLAWSAVAADRMSLDTDPKALEPVAEQATLVFVRPGKAARAITPAIVSQEGVVGWVPQQSWFTAQVAPGTYTLTSWGEGTPTLSATVEAGEIYFVRVAMKVGAWTARAHLLPVRPGTEDWQALPGWLADARAMTVVPAALEAKAKDDLGIKTVQKKGRETWAAYTPEQQAERTLTPEDGATGL